MTELSLISFVIASLVVLITPGPGVLYVVARGLGQGPLAALASAAGLSFGVFFHVLLAVVGLSAVLLASATAFSVLKLVGAAYLIFLGIQTLRSTRRPIGSKRRAHQPLRRLFWDGVIVSVFNPKIAVFFLAFLPQFVSAEAGTASWQILGLGTLYALLAFVTDGAYGLVAAGLSKGWRQRIFDRLPLHALSGSVLIGLGVKTALDDMR